IGPAAAAAGDLDDEGDENYGDHRERGHRGRAQVDGVDPLVSVVEEAAHRLAVPPGEEEGQAEGDYDGERDHAEQRLFADRERDEVYYVYQDAEDRGRQVLSARPRCGLHGRSPRRMCRKTGRSRWPAGATGCS